MSALQELLKDTFGYDDFRPGQETIIRHVLRQENVLGIMPTGGGNRFVISCQPYFWII